MAKAQSRLTIFFRLLFPVSVIVVSFLANAGHAFGACTHPECGSVPPGALCCCNGGQGDSCSPACLQQMCQSCSICGEWPPDGGECFFCAEACPDYPCTIGATYCNGLRCEFVWPLCSFEDCPSGGGGGGGGGCFLADTKIATPGGEKNIQDIKVGDTVVGINPETGERVETEVQDTHKTIAEEYYEITIEKPDGAEEVLKVTGEHPLLVRKRPNVGNILQALLDKISNIFKF